ncbi:MAG: hypothetical protein UU47_C0025G0004 [candidate division TM6 bacterium GW2011_GWE2_41_16]|nr:MAG: hypothetical protein UU47_C0025G0004 [candidate division TM6 bacterium GW2011_GWE2_41_16]
MIISRSRVASCFAMILLIASYCIDARPPMPVEQLGLACKTAQKNFLHFHQWVKGTQYGKFCRNLNEVYYPVATIAGIANPYLIDVCEKVLPNQSIKMSAQEISGPIANHCTALAKKLRAQRAIPSFFVKVLVSNQMVQGVVPFDTIVLHSFFDTKKHELAIVLNKAVVDSMPASTWSRSDMTKDQQAAYAFVDFTLQRAMTKALAHNSRQTIVAVTGAACAAGLLYAGKQVLLHKGVFTKIGEKTSYTNDLLYGIASSVGVMVPALIANKIQTHYAKKTALELDALTLQSFSSAAECANIKKGLQESYLDLQESLMKMVYEHTLAAPRVSGQMSAFDHFAATKFFMHQTKGTCSLSERKNICARVFKHMPTLDERITLCDEQADVCNRTCNEQN